MPRDSFDYGRMIAHALRDVARQALYRTAEEGLPGEHHFYLSFRTTADGVHLPNLLRDQYPDEITVVLQNQFWDLVVDHDAFSVTLTFNGARQRIVVPFDALTAFADPSAQLGLRFEPTGDGGEGDEDGDDDEDDVDASPFGGGGSSPFTAVDGGRTAATGGGSAADEAEEPGVERSAEVVHLDRFRRRAENGASTGAENEAEDGAEDPAGDPTRNEQSPAAATDDEAAAAEADPADPDPD